MKKLLILLFRMLFSRKSKNDELEGKAVYYYEDGNIEEFYYENGELREL